jgi:hypothetical protein
MKPAEYINKLPRAFCILLCSTLVQLSIEKVLRELIESPYLAQRLSPSHAIPQLRSRNDAYSKNTDYARLSSEVISHLGLADKIRIENRKGEYLINSNYSVVVVALLAKPKNEILKRLTERISSHARLICRTADPLRQAFYEAAEPECFELLKIVRMHHARGNQTISSVLLKPVNY